MRLLDHTELDPEEMSARAATFLATMQRRRTTRHFSDRDVPRGLIEVAIATAGTAPSGAHLQPWTFVVVQDLDLKRSIRQAAEAEEQRTYTERMPDAWREVLAPLGTDAIKPHLTDAPWVVVLFQQTKRARERGDRTHLLRHGILRHRGRALHRRRPSDGLGDAHPYPLSDAVPG